jgi:alcohol dehydrogenase
MRALILTRYGGPEATETRDGVPEPSAGPNEVRVQVRAAGRNPIDFKTREGKLKMIRRYRLPAVMGNEIAGVVESVGSGVTRRRRDEHIEKRSEAVHNLEHLFLVGEFPVRKTKTSYLSRN